MSSAAPPADAAARFAAVLPLAQAWFDDDPDEHTRAELADLLTHAESGDTAALLDLEDRFVGPLEFGTAGLRGRLGAGPVSYTHLDVYKRQGHRRRDGHQRHRARPDQGRRRSLTAGPFAGGRTAQRVRPWPAAWKRRAASAIDPVIDG